MTLHTKQSTKRNMQTSHIYLTEVFQPKKTSSTVQYLFKK